MLAGLRRVFWERHFWCWETALQTICTSQTLTNLACAYSSQQVIHDFDTSLERTKVEPNEINIQEHSDEALSLQVRTGPAAAFPI